MSMKLTVGRSGDYYSIDEALKASSYEEPTLLTIDEGRYREKVFTEKRDLIIKGAGIGKTVLEYGDGAFDDMPDGSKRGTFRTQTLFLGGERCEIHDMTVINSAGDGEKAGQAIAVYADAAVVVMNKVELSAHQDTLFLAPLPIAERQINGFAGPRRDSERKLTRQYYKDCIITGDVDFIFGGADAVFDHCEIVIRNRRKETNGFVTAPSENLGELGFVFRNCVIHGETDNMEGTVFLGRPWRPTGKAAFLNCKYDPSVNRKRFSGWACVDADENEATFSEYNPMNMQGESIDISDRNPWVRLLTDEEFGSLNEKADSFVKTVNTK